MKKIAIALFAVTAVMAVSCQDKLETGIDAVDNHASGSSSHAIDLIVSTAQPSTRAVVSGLHIEQLDVDGAGLELQVDESPLSSLGNGSYPTKGAPITDSIFKANKKFVLYMYENNAADVLKDTLVDSSFVAYNKSNGKWRVQDTINCMWPSNSLGLIRDFWAFQEFDSLSSLKRIQDGTDKTKHYMEFKYAAGGAGVDSARLTKDMMMAYDKVSVGTKLDDTIPAVKLDFIHPLCGIQFQIGDLGIDYGLTVTKIELNGLKYKGSCMYDPSQAKDSLKFIWTLDSDTKTYVQEYTMKIADYRYEKNFDYDSITFQKTFFVMPQVLDDGAQLIVTFSKNGAGTTQLVKQLNKLGAAKLQPGSLYTYRISGGGAMGMQVFYNSSQEYLLKDTGNVKCYFRAEIVANWYKDTAIVAPWNGQAAFDATLTAYTATTLTDSVWVKGPDGFYYYTQPVEAYHDTKVLIKPALYKGTSSSTVLGQKLRFSVAGQMIRWSPSKDYVTKYWGLTETEANTIFKH